MLKRLKQHILYIAFAQVLVAILGSLYFSEILHFAPCVLCWHQRILMYPLAVILAVGILIKDKKVYLYVLPLSLIGEFIAIYHNLLYYHFIPESLAPCVSSVSCTDHSINLFGFIGIPLLALGAFSIINLCMYIFWRDNKGHK